MAQIEISAYGKSYNYSELMSFYEEYCCNYQVSLRDCTLELLVEKYESFLKAFNLKK
jgi:hypothetical protein